MLHYMRKVMRRNSMLRLFIFQAEIVKKREVLKARHKNRAFSMPSTLTIGEAQTP